MFKNGSLKICYLPTDPSALNLDCTPPCNVRAEWHLAGTGFQQLFFGSHLVMLLRLIGSDNLVPQNVK